jgi:NADPH-dependent 7-cyano-7-deazaguanine reductase QueF-like protein
MKRWSEELIYTILVDGQPVVTLEAKGREAAELCREEWFRAELSALNSNGEPICGTGKLQARTATKEEIAEYWQGSKEA